LMHGLLQGHYHLFPMLNGMLLCLLWGQNSPLASYHNQNAATTTSISKEHQSPSKQIQLVAAATQHGKNHRGFQGLTHLLQPIFMMLGRWWKKVIWSRKTLPEISVCWSTRLKGKIHLAIPEGCYVLNEEHFNLRCASIQIDQQRQLLYAW
jgi:hypothetical protein